MAKNSTLARSNNVLLCVQFCHISDKAQKEVRDRSCAYNRPTWKQGGSHYVKSFTKVVTQFTQSLFEDDLIMHPLKKSL